jgi:hypothetical protein
MCVAQDPPAVRLSAAPPQPSVPQPASARAQIAARVNLAIAPARAADLS